ncbi:MAG TPA: PDZ domain-containing protein [Thermoanaerobaculia bacterium]
MWNRKVFRATAWGLALGLGILAGAAHAEGDGDEPGKQVVKKRVVVVDKDGKQTVYDGDGPMVRRGYLGVALTDLTPELRSHFGVPDDAGVMVAKVEPGSPAEKAGIKVGDILTRVDGGPLKSSWDVTGKIRKLNDGQQVPVEVWRNGKAQNVTVTIVEKERPEIDMGPLFFKEEGEGKTFVVQGNPGEWKEMADKAKAKGGTWVEQKDGPVRHIVSPREVELEKKLKALEKRIEELEKQLKKQ